jgi:hypothetical protein
MTAPLVHQRCWNHELREAVCRCPSCGRHFCRECVTEHEARLLCAACLEKAAAAVGGKRSRARVVFAPAAAVAGLLLTWLVFYATGEILMEITARTEQTWLH